MANTNKHVQEVRKRIVPVAQAEAYVKVLLYGRNGHGKTRIAASGPRTLIVDINEKGTQSVRERDADVFAARRWTDLTYLYWYLRDGDHDYQTVAVDTLTQAQNLCMAHVLKRAEDRDPNRPPSMPDRRSWGQLGELLKPWILDMRNLPLNVVFVTQLRKDTGDDDDEEVKTRFVPDLSPSVRGTAMSAVGIMGYVFQREVEVGRRDKSKKKGNTRKEWRTLMMVGPHDDYETKDRTFNLGRIVVNPSVPKFIAALQAKNNSEDK